MSRGESNFSKYDITADEAVSLKRHSQGILDIREFSNDYWPKMDRVISGRFNEPVYRGNALGISEIEKEDYSAYAIACMAYDLRHCGNYYEDYGITDLTSSNHPDINLILTMLTNESTTPIVFFVPEKARSYRKSKTRYTAEELEWSINNPEYISSMVFVLGLYEHVVNKQKTIPQNLIQAGKYLIDSLL